MFHHSSSHLGASKELGRMDPGRQAVFASPRRWEGLDAGEPGMR